MLTSLKTKDVAHDAGGVKSVVSGIDIVPGIAKNGCRKDL
jgi:hypothetical protein